MQRTEIPIPSSPSVRRSPHLRDAKRKVCITPANMEIVLFFTRYPVATRNQLLARFGLSLHWGNKVLRRLFDAKLLRKLDPLLPGGTPFSQQTIYALSDSVAAAQVVANALECEIAHVKRLCRPPAYLLHALMITGVGVALECATYGLSERDIRLGQIRVERDAVDRFSLRASGESKEQAYLIRPDLFVSALVGNSHTGLNGMGGPSRVHLAVECDRGHVSAGAWQEKAKSYAMWVRSKALAQVHGFGPLRVLVITSGQNRLAHLASLCRDVNAGRLYFFTTQQAFEEASRKPEWYDLPLWQCAGGESGAPCSLVDLLTHESFNCVDLGFGAHSTRKAE